MRIAHANIQASDARESVAFYRALGLEPSGCLDLGHVTLLYLTAPGDVQGPTIELAINPALAERHPGSGHVALAVGDLDALLADLASVGITPERAPFHPGDRDELRVCFVVDPDGVRVELIQGEFATPADPVPPSLAEAVG